MNEWLLVRRLRFFNPLCVISDLSFQVRLQVQSIDKPLYRGTFHCFQSIIRQESVREVMLLIPQQISLFLSLMY